MFKQLNSADHRIIIKLPSKERVAPSIHINMELGFLIVLSFHYLYVLQVKLN